MISWGGSDEERIDRKQAASVAAPLCVGMTTERRGREFMPRDCEDYIRIRVRGQKNEQKETTANAGETTSVLCYYCHAERFSFRAPVIPSACHSERSSPHLRTESRNLVIPSGGATERR